MPKIIEPVFGGGGGGTNSDPYVKLILTPLFRELTKEEKVWTVPVACKSLANLPTHI
jgi:hypothetical protein